MPFVKGKSGNPMGRPRGVYNITEKARQYGPKAIEGLVEIAENIENPPAARVSAYGQVLDRGYGKPPQFSTSDADQFRKAVDMTDDELASIAGRGCRQAVAETPDKAKLLKLVPVQTRTDTAASGAPHPDYKNY